MEQLVIEKDVVYVDTYLDHPGCGGGEGFIKGTFKGKMKRLIDRLVDDTERR